MASALVTFADMVATEMNQQLGLSYNDMSLEHGGVFDIGGELTPPHSTHRRGVDVDILYVFRLRGGWFGLDPSTKLGAAVRLALQDNSAAVGLRVVPESGNQIHYRYAP